MIDFQQFIYVMTSKRKYRLYDVTSITIKCRLKKDKRKSNQKKGEPGVDKRE